MSDEIMECWEELSAEERTAILKTMEDDELYFVHFELDT